ncbi:MAG TPA: hypothetical protein VMW52_05230 [Phycisphaerae bacterium]|nr:hypothetical protein [Phycisphaerae bacterium]
MNRWLVSRWLILSVLFGVAAFWLAVTFPAEGGIGCFTAVATTALAGGHLTNLTRTYRNEPTNPVSEDNP